MNTKTTLSVKEAEAALKAAEEQAKKSLEVEAARKALEAALEAEREAKVQAERASYIAAKKAEYEKLAALAQKVVDALQARNIAGTVVMFDSDYTHGPRIKLECDVAIRLEPEMTSTSSWRTYSRRTGRYILVVGESYGDKRPVRYPPKSDGSYNYDKVATRIKETTTLRAAIEERKRAAQRLESAAAQLTEQLKAKLQVEEHSSMIAPYYGYHDGNREWRCQYPEKGKVFFAVRLQVTPEQAERLVAVLRELGLNKPAARKEKP